MGVVDLNSHEVEVGPFHTAVAYSSFDSRKEVLALPKDTVDSTVVVVVEKEEEVGFDNLDIVVMVHQVETRKIADVAVVEIE